MQHDIGAARVLVHSLDGVVTFTRALPAHPVLWCEPSAARRERDALGDDERGVEADAELADEMRVLCPIRCQALKELACTRLCDRADVLDHFLPRHAHAVIGDGDRARGLVVADADLQFGVLFEQRRVGERLESQLVARIRGVRDQLAQEDLLVSVEGMHHQVQ
jgi:hypothetical protein